MAEPGPRGGQPVGPGPIGGGRAGGGRRPRRTPASQVLSARFGLPGTRPHTRRRHGAHDTRNASQGTRIDNDAWIHGVTVDEDETGIDVTVAVGTEERSGVPLEAKKDLSTLLGARPDAVGAGPPRPATHPPGGRPGRRRPRVRLATFEPVRPVRRPVSRTAVSAGRGRRRRPTARWCSPTAWSPWSSTRRTAPSRSTAWPASAGWSTAATSGDSYNYSPPGQDTVVDTPESVTVTVAEQGPVRAGAVITASTGGPTTSTAARRPGRASARWTSSTTSSRCAPTSARSGSRPPSSTRAADHRLRVHCPLPGRRSSLGGRVRLRRRAPGGSPPRGGATSSGSRPSRPGGSCRPAGSPSSTGRARVRAGRHRRRTADGSPAAAPWP